jgi:hypothetical protein
VAPKDFSIAISDNISTLGPLSGSVPAEIAWR